MAVRTATLNLLSVIGLLASLPTPCESGSFLRASQTRESDVDASLASELSSNADKGRLAELEDALRLTYASLPKNAHGNLGHKAVRYVLHRLFMQRHGWYIKGLEPNSDVHHASSPKASDEEWVPSYLQERLEQRLGDRGASLHDLATLAAALEDLVRREVVARLRMAYEIHELPLGGSIEREELDKVIETYYVSYLLANNFSATGPNNVEAKKRTFARIYTDWAPAEEWLEETMGAVRVPDEENRFNFSVATRMALRIGEEYHAFNDLECKSLKHEMQQIEGRRAGRVRLSAFYNKGLYSHWNFDEKIDYLRALGALDESDVTQPQVILPNYLMARTNCLESSDLYALCCQNECEDLMGHLEEKIGASEASIDRVIELVSALPSATVAAPRNLSASLLGRLEQVAESNSGVVPLHGRLFAQWMHHVYPRECPYPHEAGTVSPRSPDEWMKGTGQLSSKASKEEMLKQVESDTCMSSGPGSGCGDESGQSSELPWSETEELLTMHYDVPHPQAEGPSQGGTGVIDFALYATAAVAATGLGLAFVFDRCHTSQRLSGLSDKYPTVVAGLKNAGLRAALAFVSLGSAACALDLMDKTVFVVALLVGLCAHAFRFSALAMPKASQYKDAKSYV